MTLPTNKLVEYWYNQQGFFTMKGENGHYDLLAVQHQRDASWRYIHCEICIHPDEHPDFANRHETSDHHPTISTQVERWMNQTYTSFKKRAAREKLIPNVEWEYVLVYRDETKIQHLKQAKPSHLTFIPIQTIIADLKEDEQPL
ncbi:MULTISPECIES: hypothetical protein [Shouchella]|uniref:Uncharacterized protein n=2 Tax=Shouchella TaxID=2893057 RepID=A0ABY7W286_9BACI|nr:MULTISPECIES: hypothetical protein [Shouchella]MED4128138.1 hypothetical protein [Shouchella miscanthi]WDF02161.1 hypothetical protein PQ477_11555 [Shouchella hunanensis]GAF23134.1 hypothetical protein JCM19047_2927 [Bacillus sp. JCM 19047]